MAELKFELHSPLTEENWDLITDVDLDHTPSVTFHTKHGKDVEYVKVKHGRWINEQLASTSGGSYSVVRCSVCKAQFPMYKTNYCPNCGARMDK